MLSGGSFTALVVLFSTFLDSANAVESCPDGAQEPLKSGPDSSWCSISDQPCLEAIESQVPAMIKEKTTADSNLIRQDMHELEKKLWAEVRNMKKELDSHMEDTKARLDKIREGHQALSPSVSKLTVQVDRHAERLATLEGKGNDILTEMANFKKSVLTQLNSLEEIGKDSISGDEVLGLFHEELEKVLEKRDSPLRQWLDVIFASKEDLERVREMMDELPPAGGADVSMKKEIGTMITLALSKYSADKIGKFDFALESAGGSVMLNHCSPSYSHRTAAATIFGFPLWHIPSTPKHIIKPDVYPGNCWTMEGQSGFVTIKLRDNVVITGITLDHIPHELTPNGILDSAPKDFSVYGLNSLESEHVKLGTFTYDINSLPIQQFTIKGTPSMPYHFIRVEFESNHGHPDYTCIYRVRVHGHYP